MENRQLENNGGAFGKGKGQPARRMSAAMNSMSPKSEGLLKWPLPNQEWLGNLAKYLEFVRANGRAPKQTYKDMDEYRLAAWYNCQAMQSKRGGLPKLKEAILAEAGVPIMPSGKDEKWHKELESYLEFVRTHGRAPKMTMKDPGELMLAMWLGGQVRPSRIGSLPPEKRKLLEEHGLIQAAMTNEKKWRKHLADYLEFVEKHGRTPSTFSGDAEEIKLARWRANQAKNNWRHVPPEKKNVLEEKGILAKLPRGRSAKKQDGEGADSAEQPRKSLKFYR